MHNNFVRSSKTTPETGDCEIVPTRFRYIHFSKLHLRFYFVNFKFVSFQILNFAYSMFNILKNVK